MSQDKRTGILTIAAIFALSFLLWRILRKKPDIINPEPATTEKEVRDQFQGDPDFNLKDYCQNVIYRPVETTDLKPATFLGAGWCYKGDTSIINYELGFGDRYAGKQARDYIAMKEREAIMINNRLCVQFKLVNTGAVPITTDILDTTKDSTVFSEAAAVSTELTDIDGNVYTAIRIGSKEWISENLKTTKYADGSAIPNITADTNNVLAGTSPSALILSSVDEGIIFNSTGSKGAGNPTCFCKIDGGDVFYGTDSGYVVNYTQNTTVLLAVLSINAIISIGNNIYAGNSGGRVYESTDNGLTFHILYSSDVAINGFTVNSTGLILIAFADDGIYRDGILVQAGEFICGLIISNNNLYAGDSNGHVWKSVDDGATWSDLGAIVLGGVDITSIIYSGTRFLVTFASTFQISYFDDEFITKHDVITPVSVPLQIIIANGNILLAGCSNGKIYRSEDNGTTWDEIAGNPQQGESSINCLISTEEQGWLNDTDGAYCWYDNDSVNGDVYGALYNWPAVNNSKGLAYFEKDGVQQAGWRVATLSDWQTQINYAGGESIAGGKLKEVGFTHWNAPNTGATDEYGFAAVPAGGRTNTGTFSLIALSNYIWTANSYSATQAYFCLLTHNSEQAYMISTGNKAAGFAVRCVRDV